jgi:amino acid adenylation domain-containing protein
VERSIDMVVGLLGILKAGGAYLPLDPIYPQERLSFMLDDAQVSMLLTQEKLIAALPEHSARIVCLDADWGAVSQESRENLSSRTQPGHLAYVIYTSGSTGIPKGVLVEHQGVANFLQAIQQDLGINRHDTLLSVTTIAFDIAALELFLPLSVGAEIILLAHGASSDPEQLALNLHCYQVTAMQATPATWRSLLSSSWRASSSIKILCGGEALPRDLSEQLLALDCELWNLYGPTEATIWSTEQRIVSESVSAIVPIGAPIANTQMYVLDEQQQPVPIGVGGELYIGGAGVARGYLNRPELTAEKFIADPFSDKPEARLYRTGDLGRWRADGNIEFLGRMDSQVKLRGFRIELGEIEATLTQNPVVAQAVVIVKGEQAENKQLVAYVISTEGETISLELLREYLKTKLPEYMVPALFIVLEALPLKVNGKVDRKALSTLEGLELSTTARYVPPQTPTQELLSQVWSEVLHRERVGIHDNFFELGGHSLLATQLISRVREVFKVELPLRALFEQPTIAGLAQALQRGEQVSASIVPIERDEQSLPLSFAQQRLWFLGQLEGPSATYNIPMALRLIGTLDVAALEHCLSRIVQRHEVLRTHFAMVDGSAVQIIAPHLEIPLPVIDLQYLSKSLQQLEVQRLVSQEAGQFFNLSTGPLLRINLLHLSTEEHVLLLTMHHIISDGWSMGVLVQEVTALYQAYITDTPAELAELPIQYADFAHWQRQWLQGEVLQAQVDYWKEQLDGAPPLLELPTDRPRPSVQSFRGSHLSFNIPAELTQRLQELSRQQGVTLFMTLLSAYAILLSRYSGQQDIVIGSPIANRNRAQIENLIGFFANTLALRIDLRDNPSFEQLLECVRQVTSGAYEHQDLSFDRVVEELQPQRSLSYNPVFQVMFALQNIPMGALELPGLNLSPLESDSETVRFDLEMYLWERTKGLSGHFVYNADLFDAYTVHQMAVNFQTLLKAIIVNPEHRLLEFPLLTEAERQQSLLMSSNGIQVYTNGNKKEQIVTKLNGLSDDEVNVLLNQLMGGESG